MADIKNPDNHEVVLVEHDLGHGGQFSVSGLGLSRQTFDNVGKETQPLKRVSLRIRDGILKVRIRTFQPRAAQSTDRINVVCCIFPPMRPCPHQLG